MSGELESGACVARELEAGECRENSTATHGIAGGSTGVEIQLVPVIPSLYPFSLPPSLQAVRTSSKTSSRGFRLEHVCTTSS
jgi:hypothetical protein